MATYLDETVPADGEAYGLGASRIRQLKQDLDAALDQIFVGAGTPPSEPGGSAPVFQTGWIQESMLPVGTGAIIGAEQIILGSITAAQINPLTIDDSLIVDATITPDKLASDFICPTASVNAAALSVSGLAGALVPSMMSSGLVQAAVIRSYTGTPGSPVSVISLSFTPTVVIIVRTSCQGISIAFQSEVGYTTAGYSPIHNSWDNFTIGAIGSPYNAAVSWNTASGSPPTGGGFGIVAAASDYTAAENYTYIALLI
jgi:hypothetical protein